MRKSMLRAAAALGLAAAMLTSLAVMATVALGKPSSAQYQYKVLVCHRTHSKKKPFHTISVAAAAVPAHLRHGDTLGACASQSVNTSAGTTAVTKGKGHGNGHGKGKGNKHTTGTTTTTSTTSTTGANGNGNGNGQGKGKNK